MIHQPYWIQQHPEIHQQCHQDEGKNLPQTKWPLAGSPQIFTCKMRDLIKHKKSWKILTCNLWQMMAKSFSFFVNSKIQRQVLACIIFLSFFLLVFFFLPWAYCNTTLSEILFIWFVIQCVKERLLPCLYLVDEKADSSGSLWKFSVSNIFFKKNNLWTTKEWVSEIRSQVCQVEQPLYVYRASLLHPSPLFSIAGNRGQIEYNVEYSSDLSK